MKFKKIILTSVSLVMIASMLASCGTKQAEVKPSPSTEPTKAADTTDAATTEEATTPAEGEREKVGDMYKTGTPIVDPGTYSFTLFVDDGKEDNLYTMLPMLEEETGIKVDVKNYPYTVAQEKLAIQLNTGEYADCIGGWTLKQDDILTLGVNEGVYIPIDGYIKDYAPKITEILDIEGVRETMTTPDGHIYSIPYVLEAPLVPWLPYINTLWLEKVGMKAPTTTEELRAVLKAFKEQDANGNGDPNDEIPFTFNPDNKNIGLLAGWFGMSVDKYGFTMVGDKLTFGANTEEFKEGMKYLASLYKEGLIDKETFTQDASQWKAKGAQNIYGAGMTYGGGDIIKYETGVKPDWEAIPVLSSPNTPKPVYLRGAYKADIPGIKAVYGTDILKNQVVITDKAKNPEIIVRWWDNFFQFKNVAQSQRGPIGVTLFEEADGIYKNIDVTKMSEADRKLYEWGNLFPQSLPKYTPIGYRYLEENPAYEEKPVSDALYEPFLTEHPIPKYWVNADDATKVADLQTAIEKYLVQKTAEWVSGQVDIDADWDSYKAQLEKLKVQELVDIRVKALNK